jgi:transposase
MDSPTAQGSSAQAVEAWHHDIAIANQKAGFGGMNSYRSYARKYEMQTFLTPSERTSLKLAHRSERDRKIGDRMKVVLLCDQGESFAVIAKFLFIDEQTARRHMQDYFNDKKLDGSSGGSVGKLSTEQATQLSARLIAGDMVSAQSVVQIAKSLFGVKFSLSGMTDWLKNNDFSFKKSQPAPAKADPIEQLASIVKYRALKDNLPEGDVLLFLDAAHPTMATKLGYGWSPKGERKIVATTAGKARVNVIGSLEPATMKLIATFPETVNSETLAEHFARLRRSYPRTRYDTLNIILDQGSYCVSKATLAEAVRLDIKLWHLPPYSPNLNLIERAWKVMNEQVRNNVYFPDAKIFTSTIKDFFLNRWSKLSKSLTARFADNFQIIQKPAF